MSYWRDRVSLRSGDAFEERISQAIARFDKFLVVLSAQSLKSDWVLKEIQHALTRKNYDILPITVDNAVLAKESELPIELRSQSHVADFSTWRKPKDFGEQFKLLLSALERD